MKRMCASFSADFRSNYLRDCGPFISMIKAGEDARLDMFRGAGGARLAYVPYHHG